MKNRNLIIMLATVAMSIGGLTGCKKKPDEPKPVDEKKDLTTMVGRISYAARKYDKSLTKEKILEGAKVANSSIETQEAFYDELYYAFKDLMPELDKTNLLVGQFENDQVKELGGESSLDPEYRFFLDKGLMNKSNYYNGQEEIDEETQNVIIQRIHTYIGKSEVDDFCVSTNYDVLNADNVLEKGKTSEVETIIDMDKYRDNISKIIEDTKKANKSEEKPLVDLYNRIGETLDLSKDTVYQTLIQSNEQISTKDEYFDWQKECMDKTMCSGFSCIYFDSFYVMETSPGHKDTFFGVTSSAVLEDLLYYAMSNYSSAKNMLDTVIRIMEGYSIANYYPNYNSRKAGMKDAIWTVMETVHEIASTLPSISNNYILLSENDPFVAAGQTSDYSFKSFLPSEFQSHADKFAFNAKGYRILACVAKLMDHANCIEGLKDMALLDLVFGTRESLQREYEKAKIDVDFVVEYGDFMIIETYRKSQKYKDDCNALKKLFNDYLLPSFTTMLNNSLWLSNKGIEACLEKLNNMGSVFFFEYNDTQYGNTHAFDFNPTGGLLGMDGSYTKTTMLSMIEDAERIADPESENFLFYTLSPLEANAFYYPNYNCFCICLGFELAKDFISDLTLEEQLAEFGIVIGHEITHGFDNNGCYYDKDGEFAPNSILPDADVTNFSKLTGKMVSYYGSYELIVDVHCDGNNVVGEAIADQGGLNMCLEAATGIKGFNYERFFRTLAKNFLSRVGTRELMAERIYDDPHPFARTRINCLLINCPEFQATFKPEEGDGMYRASKEMFRIW